MTSTILNAQRPHTNGFVFAFYLKLLVFWVPQVEAGSLVSRLTDQDLAGLSLRGQARRDIDVIAQGSEIRWTVVAAAYHAYKCQARMHPHAHWYPGTLRIAVTGEVKQALSRLD